MLREGEMRTENERESAKRVVGVSVSEWETESERAAEREMVREGCCRTTLLLAKA